MMPPPEKKYRLIFSCLLCTALFLTMCSGGDNAPANEARASIERVTNGATATAEVSPLATTNSEEEGAEDSTEDDAKGDVTAKETTDGDNAPTDPVSSVSGEGVSGESASDNGEETVQEPDEPVEAALTVKDLLETLPDDEVTLEEIMPQLFDTDILTEEFEIDGPVSGTPVDVASLWQPAPPVPPIESWSNTENYLILGTDRRPNWEIWRTDVIIVVGLDRAKRRAAIFSIPRDFYVPIPGRGYSRINTADFLGEKRLNVKGGGPALVSAVIRNTLGIPIHHWVRVEMTGFEDLVDAIGGVTIHLNCPFYEPIIDLNTGGWGYFSLPAGDVTLDGEDAHWYARLRLRGSDFGRSRRQRQLLWGLREKMLNANLILRLPDLWSALSGKFETDLGLLDVVQLAQFGLPLSSDRVHAGALTSKELQPFTSSAGASVMRVANLQLVQDTLDAVWDGAPMAVQNHNETETCKPPPRGAPIFPTPTPTP